jgi:hypothetical protein
MRVLVACEFSGIVREAFRDRGHDAWSCDLLPAEDGSEFHIQGDCGMLKARDWDMMIAHPPCTYLCNSGVRWLARLRLGKIKIDSKRHDKMKEACDLFAQLLTAPIPRIAIENPVMHKYARDYLQETWRFLRHDARPTQTIQPWQFGHGETKKTCLWLKNLPPLQPTNIVEGRRTPRVHYASPGPSRTLPGIAAAMVEQWGNL